MFKKMRPFYLYMITAAVAFGAFILLINTNAYFWDRRGLNWIPLCVGIVLGLFAIYLLSIVVKRADTPKSE